MISALLFSCLNYRDNILENKYPSDVFIPGIGTLRYIRTIWDQNNKNNRRGVEIYDAVVIDDEIWIFASDNFGDTLFKGINRSASVTIQYPSRNDLTFRYSVREQRIISKGDNLLFFLTNDSTYYEDGGINIYYITSVNRNNLNRQYIRMTNIFDGRSWPFVFYGNENMFFQFTNFDQENEILFYSYYMLKDDFKNVIELTKEEFDELYSPNSDFVTDNNNRLYRLNENRLEVSVDNGETWYGNDMGTNAAKSVIFQNNSIYVFSGQIFEMFSKFHSESVGGGIHEFKWN